MITNSIDLLASDVGVDYFKKNSIDILFENNRLFSRA